MAMAKPTSRNEMVVCIVRHKYNGNLFRSFGTNVIYPENNLIKKENPCALAQGACYEMIFL